MSYRRLLNLFLKYLRKYWAVDINCFHTDATLVKYFLNSEEFKKELDVNREPIKEPNLSKEGEV